MITNPSFAIKRLSPEEAAPIQIAWLRAKRKAIQRSYNITTDDQRYQLLHKVLSKEMTVSEAAVKYGLKYTTAKNVLNLFLREGRIEKKKKRRKPYADGLKSEGNTDKKICQNVPPSPVLETAPAEPSQQKDVSKGNALSDGFWANRITEHLG